MDNRSGIKRRSGWTWKVWVGSLSAWRSSPGSSSSSRTPAVARAASTDETLSRNAQPILSVVGI